MTAELAVPEVHVDDLTLKYLGLDANSIQTRALVLLCERYSLDPLLGHATIIKTAAGYRPYITRDGMLEIAHRSGELDGIVVDEERRNSTNDGWTAYVSVWRKDMSHPFRYGAQCKDSEPQARSGNGPEMALARAERRALRRAFRIPAPELLGDEEQEEVQQSEGAVELLEASTVRAEEANVVGPRVLHDDIGRAYVPAATSNEFEWLPPTAQQRTRLRELWAQLGMGAPSFKDARLSYAANVVGHEIADVKELSQHDYGLIIAALEQTAVEESTPLDES